MDSRALKTLMLAAATVALASCTMEIEPENGIMRIDGEYPSVLELVCPQGDPQTKVDFSPSGSTIAGVWSDGDKVSIVPGISHFEYAGVYQVQKGGSSKGTFEVVTAPTGRYTKTGVFYPADKVKSDIQFIKFSYLGQKQSKAAPMAHLKDYFSFRSIVTSYDASTLDINSDITMSSCLHLSLSGMTFNNPTKIQVNLSGASFYLNNRVSTYYNHSGNTESYTAPSTGHEMTLELEGYGIEQSIDAYIMMSNFTVSIPAGGMISVFVNCEDGDYYVDIPINKAYFMTGGHTHNLTIDSSWVANEPDNTVYPYDGEVVTLQEGVPGCDLVVMGDGFVNADFEDGTYDAIMREAVEDFFAIEPYTYFRDKFCVYYVKAVSPERCNATNTGANGATNTGTTTKFSTVFKANSTSLSGNTKLALDYAEKAFKTDAANRRKNACVMMMVNQRTHAGTCHSVLYYTTEYGLGYSVGFCTLGSSLEDRHKQVRHEVGGHGFGKLADEYTSSTISDPRTKWSQMSQRHQYGFSRNVDNYVKLADIEKWNLSYSVTNKTNVYWSDMFDTANKYESSSVESLGMYEGGYGYSSYFCRPTQDGSKSIMSKNTGNYNAISRRQIFYRIRRLAKLTTASYSDPAEFQAFLDWDRDYFLPKLAATKAAQWRAPQLPEDDGLLPLAEPVETIIQDEYADE